MNFKDIYNNLPDFDLSNYSEFINNINESFHALTKVDYQINNDDCISYDIQNLTKEHLHDRFAITYDNVRFDCLISSIPLNVKSLFFIFSGSRRPGIDKLPIFKRWSYYSFVGADTVVINIADPMFYEYEKLALGWYYGSKNTSYLYYLSEIIKKIQNLFAIENRNTFLFGSSGGGYVSLQLSMYFNDTTHIVINPQININQYTHKQHFVDTVGISLVEKDPHRRNETLDIVADKISRKLNKFIILQNLTDEHDCTCHLFPLLKKINIGKAHLGLNCYDNLFVWLYTCVGGHNAQGDQYMFSYIIYLTNKVANDEEITDFDFFLFKNLSILWRQREYFMDVVMNKNK